MKVAVELGTTKAGDVASLDLEELLSTRLLVQGNSGSGKSHLLRRLLEQSAKWVQQAIIDPEGDFVSFAERYGHVIVDAGGRTPNELQKIAARIREHRASVVLDLEGLDAEVQMHCASAFLNGLFEADRNHWYPMLIAVDEAQLFAPAIGGEVADDARKASLGAMTNLMCRGRKRGLAGIIATQRLAKLAKNVAAEATNFLMGRTFLDIDMARAADLLGMERRQAERFRDLDPGQFVALGPALYRRPTEIRIGAVETAGRSGRPTLMPLPARDQAQVADLIFSKEEEEAPRFDFSASAYAPAPRETSAILAAVEKARPAGETQEKEGPGEEAGETENAETGAGHAEAFAEIFAELLADPDAAFRPTSLLYQDFLFHCRVRKLSGRGTDLPAFRRRLAFAVAGTSPETADPAWTMVVEASGDLPEEMQRVFLMVARAAREERPCPSDEALARAYGSHSPSRGRWLLTYMAGQNRLTCENDYRGNRIVTIAGTGWRTASEGSASADEGLPKAAGR